MRAAYVLTCAIATVVFLAGASPSHAGPSPAPADGDLPVAPKLTDEPIQYLDRLYQDGFVDSAGRAWLLVRKIGLSDVSRNTAFEYLVCPDLPGKVLEFPAPNIPIGFDTKGRYWDVTRYGLGCTDVATQDFTERELAPGMASDRLPKPHPPHPQFRPGFSSDMLEHSSGRMYFIDTQGVHVLDGRTWSYQFFGRAPKKWADERGSAARLIECPDGTVLTWGSHGLWSHDGKRWRRHPVTPYELAPLADGQCLVMTVVGDIGRMKRFRLGDGKWVEVDGRDPLKTGFSNFKHVLTVPRGATLVKGYDRARKVYVLAMITPAGEVHELPRAAQLSSRPRPVVKLPDGRVVLPTRPLYTWDGRQSSPLFANPMAVPGRYLGVDKRGRVLLKAEHQAVVYSRTRLAVVSPRCLTAPPSLPVEMFGHIESAVLDSGGQVWAKFTDQAFLSRYDAGRWRHTALPAGLRAKQRYAPYRPMMLQPLAHGCLLAGIRGRGACFFDGRGWRGYPSLAKLVESHADRLRKVIDNRRGSDGGSILLGLDAGGRIWARKIREPRDFKAVSASVYDGREWQGLMGGFVMGPDGARCVRQTRGVELFDVTAWPPEHVSSLPEDRRSVYFDIKKRLITEGGYEGPAWRWNGTGWTKLPVPGRCVLADSTGGLWFNRGFSKMTLVDANGRVGPTYDHGLNNKGPVVEQAPGVYWCAASDGLMQLGVKSRKGKPCIVVRKRYGDLIPQGEQIRGGKVRRLFLDGDDALWIVTDRLARIKVPPATTPKGRR